LGADQSLLGQKMSSMENFNRMRPRINFLGLCVCLVLAGCAKKNHETTSIPKKETVSIPNVVTRDIQDGIEKYIEEKTKAGNGYFSLNSEGKTYLFKLVRVHTEYLSVLGPRRHFACVDLVDTKGDVYDVDFFLAGDPGDMTVTETTLHKLNGIPFYAWEQDTSGTWSRVSIKGAPQQLLGVVTGKDEFEFNYQVTLPVIKNSGRIWLPLSASDTYQQVKMKIITAPANHQVLKDKEFGNKVLFIELGPEDSEKEINIHYQVVRTDKAAYVPKEGDFKRYLREEKLVPNNKNFGRIARDVVKNKKGDLVQARALFDHVVEQMSYKKFGSGWGKGDAVYACDIKTGNCTDFHSYFIALARAVKIPSRFAIGVAIPSARNDGGVDGYHCWAEFYAEGKWWPVDISEADKYSSLATYYFGHHPANRLEFSKGRDLVVEPGPASGPINFLAFPVLELNKKQVKASVKFSFKRQVSNQSTL